MDILERLDEPIISDSLEKGLITSTLLAERLIKERKEAADEIERLRDKYDKMLAASAIFQIMIHNSLFVFEKTVDDIQQKDSE